MANGVEYLSMCLLVIPSLEKCLFWSLPFEILSYLSFCYGVVRFENYVTGTNPLLDLHFANIFLPFCALPFHLLDDVLYVAQVLTLVKSSLAIFFFSSVVPTSGGRSTSGAWSYFVEIIHVTSSKSFAASALTFRSDHFELTSAQGMTWRARRHSFARGYPPVPVPPVGNITLSPIELFGHPCQKPIDYQCEDVFLNS